MPVIPRLSRLAASGDLDGFRDNVRKLLAAMVGATALATAVSAAGGRSVEAMVAAG